MSPSGRSAIPTDRPSSIQKPTSSARVRSRMETASSTPSPSGTSMRAPLTARARNSHAGREAYVAMRIRLGRPAAAVATDEPAPVLVDLREAGIVAQGGEVPGEHGAGRRREDADLRGVDVHRPRDRLDLERRRVDGA